MSSPSLDKGDCSIPQERRSYYFKVLLGSLLSCLIAIKLLSPERNDKNENMVYPRWL